MRRLAALPRAFRVAVTVLAGLMLAGLLGWSVNTDPRIADPPIPAPGTAESGVVDGVGPVTVQVWVNLECADCQPLLAELEAALRQPVQQGEITRIYHPVPLREETLAPAASVACAADRGAHQAYLAVLLETAGEGGVAALTDDDLVQLAGTAGVIDPAFAQCVRSQHYLGWARQVASRAAAERLVDLPAVRVANADVAVSTEDAKLSAAAVASAVAAAVQAAAMTPEPAG